MEDKELVKEFLNVRDEIIEKTYAELSMQQKSAVFSNGTNILLVACPGAGKTKTLISRIDYLTRYGPVYKSNIHGIVTREKVKQLYCISNGEHYENSRLLSEFTVKPKNIQVITFTKAAAGEMSKRYKTICSGNDTPFFGTFHSLFYKILKCYLSSISIIQEDEQLFIIKKILKEYIGETSHEKSKSVNGAISLYNASGKFSVDKDLLKYCINKYGDYKKIKNVMDFDDLQFKCIELLDNHSDLLQKYREKFKYIMIDEFQDSAKKEMEFLKLFKCSSSIFAVGDEDQSIYCFRGANPQYMVNYRKEFNNAEILFLSKNYRSKEDIVIESSKLINFNINRNPKKICAHRNGKDSIEIIMFEDESQQDTYISNIINSDFELFNEKTAILYRTNKESELIINSFITNDIPFSFLNKDYEMYSDTICKDIMCYINLAANKKDINSFIQIANKPNRGISNLVIQHIKENNNNDNWFDIIKNSSQISLESLRKCFYLKILLCILNNLHQDKKTKFIINVLGYDKYLIEYCKMHGEDIEKLYEMINKFNKYISDNNNSYINKAKKGVLLSTIHGVKGMEFDNVFIINCCEGNIPHEKSIETQVGTEEERRLFYVGITRAKNKLYIMVPQKINGTYRKPSRFLKEIK